MSALADEEASQVNAKLAQIIHLMQQPARVNHDAVANDAGDALMEDACGDEVEGELLVAMHHPVARVATALIARDVRRPVGQLVYDLALALVTPLRPDNCHDTHAPPAPYPPCWI